MVSDKLLVICGPTSTGKTSLAISLAKKFKGEIISADSRQVYEGMDIGTGKDLPDNSKLKIEDSPLRRVGIGYYEVDGVKIWGYDLVSPKKDFSVSKYVQIAKKMISNVQKRGKLPILVGGTGLYIKAVVDGIDTVRIPKNIELRKILERKSLDELFESLAELDPNKAASMNLSDRKNPRRLIRAIEVAQWRILHKNVEIGKKHKTLKRKYNLLMIGLKMDSKLLEKRIIGRIRKRLSQGMIDEIRSLLSEGVSWQDQSMSSLGYRELRDYFLGKMTKREVIDRWFLDERRYVKRQYVWFKKDKRIIWFDVSKKKSRKAIENLVRNWYYKI